MPFPFKIMFKGCSPLGEVSRSDGEGVHVCFFIFMLYKDITRHPLEPLGLFLLSVVTKGSKNMLLCKESESAKCPS